MKKEAKHVGSVLDDLLAKWGKERVERRDLVMAAWKAAVPDDERKHARPVSLKRGILMVAVENPAWLYKFTLEKRETMKRFNENYAGKRKAKDIRFRIGEVS